MATIVERRDHAGAPTYQAKLRKVGYPLMSRTFATPELAAEWADSVESALSLRNARRRADIAIREAIDKAPPDRVTLGDLLIKYRDTITPRKRSDSTERLRIGAMLRNPISLCAVAYLTNVQAAQWRDERLKAVSAPTVRREQTILAHVLQIAGNEWGIKLESNPFRTIAKPKDSRPRERRLRGDEEQRLLASCKEARNPLLLPAVLLAVETAMRQSELVTLRWENVHLNVPCVYLPDTKNGESRGVPLSSKAIAVLQSVRSDHAQVFPGLTAEALKRAFIRAARRARLEDFRFHDLRHEATSRLFEKGLTLAEVAAVTGHKTWAMLRRYTHLQLGDLARKLR
ncbi:tyrosine-type recombinase/integrase [Burkholderia multivorans]|uniref:tyrosine-type recombinase/integrase n=1 Tax=Burkholderia multivorans TaxID=87883 RepID=UPI0037369F21